MSSTMEIDIYNTLIEFLRANIADPAERGETSWIIAAFPDIQYTKPAISVMEVAMTYRKEAGHGHQGTIEGYRYQIDIFASRRVTVTISDVKYAGGRLVAYLSGAIKDAIEQNARPYFWANLANFKDIKMIMANTPPYNAGADEYRKTLGVIIEVERPKT